MAPSSWGRNELLMGTLCELRGWGRQLHGRVERGAIVMHTCRWNVWWGVYRGAAVGTASHARLGPRCVA